MLYDATTNWFLSALVGGRSRDWPNSSFSASVKGGIAVAKVLAVVDDMFFAAKIRAVAEAVGAEISFPRTQAALIEKAQQADLVIVDLHNQKIDPFSLRSELGATRLLGFFSHVEVDLLRRAVAAGYDQVLPRSVFARDLAEILTSN